MPLLAATPPWNETGGSMLLPRMMLPLKLPATAKQSPATISSTGVAICCRWIMSDLAKTLHLPAMRGGFFDLRESSLNSSIDSRSLSAC